MVRVTGELDCFSAHIRLREPDKSEDKIETAKRTQWFESGGRKGRGSDDKSSGAQLPKNQSCDGTVEAGLPWSIDPLLSWRESIDRKRGREGSMQRQTPSTKTRRKGRGQGTLQDQCRWASHRDSRKRGTSD
ncbi:hypothetical protein GW17_00024892 [Ensete ventricosum]|uniref:Uncharacterized protein n=1 Tax=Ensete ventricosum TaxID=4639 RepID=A0A444EM86_ENSVE|nr:hypothetical protein GW17_00024892 [Ensete ventricosum]RZR71218.1 hypothetical protein BHM03_00004191 [Ensete ventricosum]